MSDVLDDLEAVISDRRLAGPSVPTPAVPRERQIDDGPLVRRPIALAAMRRCLGAQELVERPGRIRGLLGADPLGPEGRRWHRVVRDDRAFAATLARGGWTTLHSLPIGKPDGDLDHLVVGGFGVVAISTVDAAEGRIDVTGGELRLDGTATRDLDRAVEIREDVASRLGVALGRSVPVAGVVVVLGRRSVPISGRSPVPVLTARQLHRWLWRREPVLTREETAAIVAAAERASVWRERPESDLVAADPAAALAFAELDARVRRARRRRTVGESAALGLLLAGLVATAVGVPGTLVAALSAALGG